jgi:hypothetical protein
MSDLAYVPKDRMIATLVEELPSFVYYNVNVGQVLDLVMGDIRAYTDVLDTNWVTLVYRLHHAEILEWCDMEYADLIDPDYEQQAVNFIMAATCNWARKFCEAYADSGKLSEMVDECKVIQFDRYKTQFH